MSSIENSGFCIFGADPSMVSPGSPPPPPPTPGGPPFNTVPNGPTAAPPNPGAPVAAMGARFPPPFARCTVHCEYNGGTKVEKAKASGKKGARQTVTGAEVAEIAVDIEWADVEPSASAMLDAIAVISPHGANAGKAWDWTERFAGVYAVGAVIVEDMKLTPDKASDKMTLKLKLSGFDKSQQTNAGTGQGTTPTSSQAYTPPGAPAKDPAFPSKPLVPNP